MPESELRWTILKGDIAWPAFAAPMALLELIAAKQLASTPDGPWRSADRRIRSAASRCYWCAPAPTGCGENKIGDLRPDAGAPTLSSTWDERGVVSMVTSCKGGTLNDIVAKVPKALIEDGSISFKNVVMML